MQNIFFELIEKVVNELCAEYVKSISSELHLQIWSYQKKNLKPNSFV